MHDVAARTSPSGDVLDFYRIKSLYNDVRQAYLIDLLNNNSDNFADVDPDDLSWFQAKVKDEVQQTMHCMRRYHHHIKTLSEPSVHSKRDDRAATSALENNVQRRLDFYHRIYQSVITVATLGGGFTFTVIFADVALPQTDYTTEQVKQVLAIAWLMFTLALLWASIITVAMSMYGKAFMEQTHGKLTGRKGGFGVHLIVISVLLSGAFLALAEALRMYQERVGVAALVLIGLLVLGLLIVISRSLSGATGVLPSNNDFTSPAFLKW